MGGNGANTSYTLARLGVPTRLVSAVGRDAFGDRLVALLGSAGVETHWIARSDQPTPATVALIREDGARALLHRPGVSREAFHTGLELAPALRVGCSHFHLANPFALPGLRPHGADLLRRARAAGLGTSLDTGWDSQGRWLDTLRECLPHIDLLFVNEEEAAHLTGASAAPDAARILRELGARDVIVKLGADGCLVETLSGQFHSPGFAVRAVDTTGAGDCFAGGFLAALQRGFGYPEAARFANAVGALSVQAIGGITGIRNFEQTLEWADQFRK